MNIRRQLIADKWLNDVDYNNRHELNEAVISAMEEYAQEQLKNCNLQSVSNWGEMKLACKYSKKHDKFTACLHKDTDPAMICFDPAHCPMIKKWSNCAFNRPDC